MTWVFPHRARALLLIVLVVGLMLGLGGLLGRRPGGAHGAGDAGPTGRSDGTAAAASAAVDRLSASITRAQDRLRTVPGDYVTWAGLGSAYLEKARITADPTYYAKAEGALRESLRVRPDGNPAALTGLGALANARHDFATARTLASQALAVNAYDAGAYGVLADALTQLGRPDDASAAIQHMLDLRPSVASLTRASYDLEQHGRLADAQALMARALQDAVDPADIAFCRYQLGELAWSRGDLDEADRQFTAGANADPSYLPLLAGQARVDAARGHTDAALTGYRTLTAAAPTPANLMEYADLLRLSGHTADADTQVNLAGAALQLFAASGGVDDLGAASLALQRGDTARAVALARAEWQRRHFADVADQLAWALHANGQDAEALGYARQATAMTSANARYLYHIGMIEAALGNRSGAATDLRRALAQNPYFSPVDAPRARRTLAGLGS